MLILLERFDESQTLPVQNFEPLEASMFLRVAAMAAGVALFQWGFVILDRADQNLYERDWSKILIGLDLLNHGMLLVVIGLYPWIKRFFCFISPIFWAVLVDLRLAEYTHDHEENR